MMVESKIAPWQGALCPQDLGLILSYRCQAACAHCLYNCGPAWHGWMMLDEIHTALENARSVWGAGFQVHLTGGEPFLNFPRLLDATKIAVELGIPVYVETNAGWVKSISKAETRFRQLREAGMAAVLVSVSPFHQAAFPLKRTLDGISAARSVFGSGRVIVYQSDWLPELAQHGIDQPVQLGKYIEKYGEHGAGYHLWQGFGLISGGRAGYTLGNLIPRHPPQAFEGIRCRDEVLFAPHSHLDLYGNFIPGFCGGISLGDWHDLADLVRGVRVGDVSALVETLFVDGPYGLAQIAVINHGYQPPEDGYAGKCHLCVDVRRHMSVVGSYPENLLPEQFYRIF